MKRSSNGYAVLKSRWECFTEVHFLKYATQFIIRSRVIQSWINVGYADTLSSDFGTKKWAIACDWENLLPGRNGKQLIIGLTIHHLTGRKDVIEMLHKLNVCSSNNDIRLQNKLWAKMVASRKRISKHML